MRDENRRLDLKVGMSVGIVLKEVQSFDYITYGRVWSILSKSAAHPHVIKVRLNRGEVGRVKK